MAADDYEGRRAVAGPWASGAGDGDERDAHRPPPGSPVNPWRVGNYVLRAGVPVRSVRAAARHCERSLVRWRHGRRVITEAEMLTMDCPFEPWADLDTKAEEGE